MPSIKEPGSGSGSGSELNGAVKEKRTRRRIIKCCENCRSTKNKCSKHPNACFRCLEHQLECIYLPQDDGTWEIIDKGKEDRRKLENRIAKRARKAEDLEQESEDGSDIEPSPLIATDAAYEDDDDIEDNGVRVGRFNLTKRIGSYYRPKMIEELTQMLDHDDLHRSEYDRQVFNSLPRPQWLDAAAGPKVLDPNPDYIAPSLFSHTLQVNQQIHKILRSRDLADKIMENYWKSVHPVVCIVHRPSFQERYDFFWCNGSKGIRDIPESTQALVYAALFAGVVSMDAENVREELGGKRQDWVEALEKATATSLSRAHVIRTEKPETIQAFVMYLIPMCRSIISRTLATLVAAAIDLARGMGLNKDGTYYGYDAVVTQVHRMIWHQLCFLDIRVCEAQSPRARIRKDEFNTELPLNVEDSELEKPDPPTKSYEGWTGMTLSNARMECNEKIREIFAARQRVRQEDKSDSTHIKKMLEMIYEFQQHMEKKYYPLTDDKIPIQYYTRLVIKLHCRRMHAMILHEYHMSTPQGRLPEQYSRTVIKSGLETMEIAKEIETSESLRPWRWYAGALQQHNYATLMLIEVFGSPGTDYAKRAWQSLDWIFQVPTCVPHIHKGRWVLEGALGIMKGYLKARKLRYPTLMDERLGTVPSSARTPTLPQPQVMSNERAGLQDMEMTSGSQAVFMHGMSCKYTEQKPVAGGLLASASQTTYSRRSSSEEDSHMHNPPNAPPDEFIDAISSWQSVVDSVWAIDHSGHSTGDQVLGPSNCLGSRVTGNGPWNMGGASCAGSSDAALDHYHYDTCSANSTPPQGLSYISTGNDGWHDNSSHNHSPRNPHSSAQILDEGSYVHFVDYPSSAILEDHPGFRPTDQNKPMPDPLQHRHGLPYAENPQWVAPANCLQSKDFGYVGASDLMEPRMKEWI